MPVPVSLVSLVAEDRQWFKAESVPPANAANQSVCAYALHEPELLVITDLTADPRTSANTLVTEGPAIRFYAGAVLRNSDGIAIGSLCVIDTVPRPEATARPKLAGAGTAGGPPARSARGRAHSRYGARAGLRRRPCQS